MGISEKGRFDSRMYPCPKCGEKEGKVDEGSTTFEPHMIKRTHTCRSVKCRHKFTTWQSQVNPREISKKLHDLLDKIDPLV